MQLIRGKGVFALGFLMTLLFTKSTSAQQQYSIVTLGFTDAVHTRNDGYRHSQVIGLSDQVWAAYGYSQRFSGSNSLGQSAWFSNGTDFRSVGLVDAEHTRNDGYRNSAELVINDSGEAIGVSNRFNGSVNQGTSVWFSDGATSLNIGMTDARHTRSDGYRDSSKGSAGLPTAPGASGLSESGFAFGHSGQYRTNSNSGAGVTAWRYNPVTGTTIKVGMVDSEHTRSTGHKHSDARQLSESGFVIGYSDRYQGIADLGRSAWVAETTGTTKIGLIGADYTRNDGYQFNQASNLNDAGHIIGFANRYASSLQIGQSAWFHDATLNQTIELLPSIRATDNYGFSEALYLSNNGDGMVLGRYTLFDAMSNNLGDRAFLFTPEQGLFDLGSLVEGGLAIFDWNRLALAIRGNYNGLIVGHGQLNSQSLGQMAFLLTPQAVPEPGLASIAVVLMASTVIRRRRRTDF